MGLALKIFFVVQAHAAFAFPENGIIPALGEKSVADRIANPPAPEDLVSSSAHNSDRPEVPDPSAPDYAKLDSFNEIAIQRKFLPKRHRFEFSLAYGRIIDNAFFDAQTYYGRMGYSIFESWAIEVSGFSADVRSSRAMDSLQQNGGTASAVASVPSSYTGLDLKWSPIYGKLAFWNSSIIPIEQFLLLGGGDAQRPGQSSISTFHAGTGFSLGVYRWLAVRAELDIYHTETHLSLGLSTFYPGPDSR